MTALLSSWETGLTMLFGSFVAGSTPLGGGAVAFPVFTKVLQVSAAEARVFSLFIQSVGMTFATLYFISQRVFIDWAVIARGMLYAVLGQLCAVAFSVTDGLLLKYAFSCFLLLVAILLIHDKRNLVINLNDRKRRYTFSLLTFLGGMITGYLGSGADTLLFFYFVLLLGSQARQMIPTTVTFMALNAQLGAVLFFVLDQQPSEFVVKSWFFAAPVVALGAPLGGYILTKLQPSHILSFVIVVIIVESVSTLLLLPLHPIKVILLSSLLIYVAVILLLKLKPTQVNKRDMPVVCEEQNG
ncbi:sulfite exporter TauE/SafE family protein [Pseudoalteromonas sp. JBTF-M23]|uniref:Probable membrane transporter protein n=1 Tax=Pseudoalteromonas caenipelagi TaxID=2726988 RepID=A0A849VEY9_9GAMM|nr:sulfite exporter TauE/SafE family protein [Pseudoalteromonas caenipelagi]NOU51073.1 sulfite exporter TauE/SafE family protein [Pseudoalteromonas caenipelagi]